MMSGWVIHNVLDFILLLVFVFLWGVGVGGVDVTLVFEKSRTCNKSSNFHRWGSCDSIFLCAYSIPWQGKIPAKHPAGIVQATSYRNNLSCCLSPPRNFPLAAHLLCMQCMACICLFMYNVVYIQAKTSKCRCLESMRVVIMPQGNGQFINTVLGYSVNHRWGEAIGDILKRKPNEWLSPPVFETLW